MSTKQQYRSYLPKSEYTIKRYCNCTSHILILVVMLLNLCYDLETCGIIIVRQAWYIRIFITRVSSFSISVFLSHYYSSMSSQCFWSLVETYWSSENIMELDCHRYNATDVDISTVSYNTKRTYDWKMEYKSRHYKC
jgi:hypothetical protein